MKFGNWKITDNSLEWTGVTPATFIITKQQLLEKEKIEEIDAVIYKWILMATQEDWFSEDELYDLNFAFVYAAGKWGESFDYTIFDKSVEYQFDILEDEEEEDEE